MVNRAEEVYTHVTMLLSPQRTTCKHVICAIREHYGASHEQNVSRAFSRIGTVSERPYMVLYMVNECLVCK